MKISKVTDYAALRVNPDIPRLKNSVDPDQLASQDPHWFPLCLQIHEKNLNAASEQDKSNEECST